MANQLQGTTRELEAAPPVTWNHSGEHPYRSISIDPDLTVNKVNRRRRDHVLNENASTLDQIFDRCAFDSRSPSRSPQPQNQFSDARVRFNAHGPPGAQRGLGNATDGWRIRSRYRDRPKS